MYSFILKCDLSVVSHLFTFQLLLCPCTLWILTPHMYNFRVFQEFERSLYAHLRTPRGTSLSWCILYIHRQSSTAERCPLPAKAIETAASAHFLGPHAMQPGGYFKATNLLDVGVTYNVSLLPMA